MMQAWLKNPRIKIALLVLAGGLVAYLAIGSWLSKVNVSEKHIHQAWGILKYNCDLRAQLVGRFEQILQTYAPQDEQLRQQLKKAATAASKMPAQESILEDQASIQQFSQIQANLASALENMEVQAQRTPMLAQNRQYLLLRMELQNIELQIRYAQSMLNREIEFYNYHISGFPRQWANALFLREKSKYPLTVATAIKKNP